MIIRQATTRDLLLIVPLFVDLVTYLRDHAVEGLDIFVDDELLLLGGITEFLAARIGLQDGGAFRVMVGQDEESGRILCFLVGFLERCPKFCRHELIGNIEYIYPLSIKSRMLAKAFDEWAKSQGATARICRADISNTRANEVYRRFEKSLLAQNVWVKPYIEGVPK
jgi:hypothetical protein